MKVIREQLGQTTNQKKKEIQSVYMYLAGLGSIANYLFKCLNLNNLV